MYDIPTKNLREISGFKETPEGWSNTTIDDLCQIGRGRVISGIEINANPGIYPVYSSQTRDQGRMGSISSYDFDGQYVTWTTDGENAGTVFFREGKFNCTNVCGTLFPKNSDVIDLKFLTYQLGEVAKSYVSYIGNPKLMNGVMGQVALIIPEKQAQQKIAHILTTVDNLIEKTQALIDKYTAVKQGMMHDLFTRGIDLATGQLRSSYEQAPELYKVTELGWVPREWGVVPLRLVVDKIADRDHFTPIYYDEGIPIISPKDFGELDKISFEKCKYISIDAHDKNRKKTDLGVNDIVFTRIGAGLGKAAIVTPDMPEFSILHSAAMIRLNRKVMEPMYLLYLLKSFVIQRQIGVEVQSIGVPDLGLEKINEFMVLCPNKNEQIKAAGSIEAIDVSIEGEYKQLKAFQLLKKGLMQDLLTGRVRVEQEAKHVN